MSTKVSLQELLDSGAHFGHQARRWNPKMAPYLYGVQDGVHVFDLVKTKAALEQALEYLKTAASEGKTILLLGTKKQAKDKVIEIAVEAGIPYVSERWLGGTFSNFDQVKKSVKKLADMKADLAAGVYTKYTKRERQLLEIETTRLERFFGGVSQLSKLPDVLVVIDTHKEIGAVKEAVAAKIPVVGIVDSNADPDMIDYPIPMNDDAVKALSYVLDLIKVAVMDGKKKIKNVKN
jgi:small subunit ribosomal protein S2